MENRVMADDIVKRLRADWVCDLDDPSRNVCEEAADEIERLRQARHAAECNLEDARRLVRSWRRHGVRVPDPRAPRDRAAAHATVLRMRAALERIATIPCTVSALGGKCPGCQTCIARAALAGGAERKPSRSVQRRIAVQKGEPMPTFGGGAEPASASPTMDQGPWTVFRDDVSGYPIGIGSDDFKRDVLLRVDGDFGCATEKADYCGWLANVLNGAANCKHCSHCGQWHNLSLGC